MSKNFPLYPNNRSNEYGNANRLETSGGLFDSVSNQPLGGSEKKSVSPDPSQKKKPASGRGPAAPAAAKPQRTVSRPSASSAAKKAGKMGVGLKFKLILALIVAAAAGLGVLAYIGTHAILGDFFGRHEIYSSGTKEINLSGSDYADYSQLSKVKSLEVLDLTHSTFVSLSDLYPCENLKKVILADRVLSAKECIDFYRHVPGAHLICGVRIDGKVYPPETETLKLEKTDSDTQKLYAALNHLKSLDLTECDVADDTYKTLAKALPDCEIVFRTVICGNEFTTDSKSLTIEGEISDDELNRLLYFKSLKTVDLRNCTNPRLLDDFLAKHPNVKVNHPIELLGKQVGSEDEIIDLRGSKYTLEQVKAALDEALPKMNALKKIDLCGCGLSNKDMEQLCEAYPDIKFVWLVKFAKWEVRTDAVAFSALNSNGHEAFSQRDYAPLFKYCTDLIALDLGHSLITDISAISSLKKLRAVILTDNHITNISAFAELKDLEFIEMNSTNKVSTVEPLKDLKKLKYINLWGSVGLTDLSPLYYHDNLKIVIFERSAPSDERTRFMESNPNCQTFFDVDRNRNLSTNSTWRENPYRVKIKNVFGRLDSNGKLVREWKYVVGFDEETEDFIIDYNTDQYKYL